VQQVPEPATTPGPIRPDDRLRPHRFPIMQKRPLIRSSAACVPRRVLLRLGVRRPHALPAAFALGLSMALCPPAAAQVWVPSDVVKVLPQVRVEPWPESRPQASRPRGALDPGARLIDVDGLWEAPRIVGTPSGRRLIGPGDVVLADRPGPTPERYDIVRGPQALLDRATGQVLGHQVLVIGSARRLIDSSPAAEGWTRLQVVQARQEIRVDDRLVAPMGTVAGAEPHPHPVPPSFRAEVIVLPEDRHVAGPGDVVVLNRGQLDGLAPGQRLKAHRAGETAPNAGAAGSTHARVVITQTHRRVARALIVDASDAVRTGDQMTPDASGQDAP
jgi:hypothetical protein